MKNKQGYAAGKINGKITQIYLDPSRDQKLQDFAFPAHTKKQTLDFSKPLNEEFHPVTSLQYNPASGILLSSGGDGVVRGWQVNEKK